jgi:hypothetical protein
MKKPISLRDWELLSEYVDRQLSPKQAQRMEARLQQNPDLRDALNDLLRLKAVLRSAPRLKAPRRFTLKPEMVSQRPSRRIYPVFQFASAVASLLFVLVLIGDLVGLGSPATLPQLAAPAAAPVAGEMYALEEPPMEPGSPTDSARKTFEADSVEQPQPGLLMLPEPTPTPSFQIESATPEAAPEERVESQPSLREEVGALEAQMDEIEQEIVQPRSVWRILQVSLALTAFITGLAALYFKRLGS